MLIPDGGGNATLPLTNPNETYTVSVAGASGEAVQATGTEGYDLHVAFQQAPPVQ